MHSVASHNMDNAHVSSVRTVAWAGQLLLSLGLDRRLRIWLVHRCDEGSLRCCLITTQSTRCTDPATMSVARTVDKDPSNLVVLAGRGLELLTLREDAEAALS